MKQITLKFTGDIYMRMKTFRMEFEFEGDTLRDLLAALFNQHDLHDLVLDEQDCIKPYSRVVVDGRFSENAGDLDARVRDNSEIVLIRPFLIM